MGAGQCLSAVELSGGLGGSFTLTLSIPPSIPPSLHLFFSLSFDALDMPTFTDLVLGLQVCTTTPSLILFVSSNEISRDRRWHGGGDVTQWYNTCLSHISEDLAFETSQAKRTKMYSEKKSILPICHF